ncbi:MAG: gliding motility protein GldL [Prevotella sp.]|jgi:gliding motility-associated protein GldL
MTEYSKYNFVYRMQKWMDSVPGQTFLNYAYSWGASIVILGALFKLTHLPGANIMLFLGMGTEVVVFFISAFDRPFDKTADGRDIPAHVSEEYLEGGKMPEEGEEQEQAGQPGQPAAEGVRIVVGGGQPVVGVVSAGSANVAGSNGTVSAEGAANAEGVASAEGAASPAGAGGVVISQPNFVPQMSSEEAEELNEAQSSYVDELKKLVETLGKVNEQSSRLTRDSEEMENLNRTLTGITKIYELQLKGASQQVGTIEHINEQTQQMAEQIKQLNKIYARMIDAMTVNMRVAAPGAAASATTAPSATTPADDSKA